MKTLRKAVAVFTISALALAGVLALPPVPTEAQDASMVARMLASGRPSARNILAVSTDVALYVRYIGTNTSGGTVTVAANGDITLSTGAVGASAVDTTLECPVSAPLGGIIDVSDTACDTLGEVVDIINGSANWIAWIRDGHRTLSSNDALATLAETAANSRNGQGLLRDGTTAFDTIVDLAVEAQNLADVSVIQQTAAGTDLKSNPYQGRQYLLLQASATSTYGSGTSTLRVYDKCVNLKKAGSGASETLTQLWSQAGGATTVAQSFTIPSYGIVSSPGCTLLVMTDNSAAMSASVLTAYATSYRHQP